MMARTLSLIEARIELLERAEPHEQWLAYVKANALDATQVCRFAGLLAVTSVELLPGHLFDFADTGSVGAVIEVRGEDAETTVDLCGWPVAAPHRFATLFGEADGLGIDQASNPATFFAGQHLQVHRTPLRWLQAGCRGCVILKPRMAPRWLGAVPGPIAGEDLQHAREVARLLHPFVPPDRVLAPLEAA